jgi:hypothetical protein
MRIVLKHHCPEQGIGSISMNNSTRTAQHRTVQGILNFQRQHATSKVSVCRLTHEDEYVLTERLVLKEIRTVN